jgi:hypothetical protein
MTTEIRSSQGKTKAAINSIRAELEEIVKHQDGLTFVDQRTRDLCEDVVERIGETQRDLEISLREEMTDTKATFMRSSTA